MELFQMEDIICLLGLPPPPQGRSAYYVQCPCCDDDPQKKHLNINLHKNVFRCPRCGISGGIFDLYSLYTGIPRDKVREALTRQAERIKIREAPQKEIVNTAREYPLTDIETRHATYTALLSMLELASDHRQNLLERGLTDSDIIRLGYKTTPVIGMTAIANELQNDGYYLAGVPGFYRNADDKWAFVHEQRGIIIPVKDRNGSIQGLQVRRDNMKKRKFRWISSSGMPDGCHAEGWTHFRGAVRPSIVLTEGPMKADIINALSNLTVLAVPGVNSLTQLRTSLDELKRRGVSEIKTAFDMDFFKNVHVQSGYNSLLALLNEMGFRYGTYVWDPRYKGLDDYIWAHTR